MGIEQFISDSLAVAQQHTIITIAIIGTIGVLAYKKPTIFFQIVIVILLFGGVFFATSYLGEPLSTGVQQKDKLAYKTNKEMN